MTVNAQAGGVPDSAGASQTLRQAMGRGAMWMTVVSAVAMPLSYYVNWALGRADPAGKVVGQYAVMVLFVQVVTAFVLFGGSSAVTASVAALRSKTQSSAFLNGYTALSILALCIFTPLLLTQPDLAARVLRQPVGGNVLLVLACAAPLIVFSQIAGFFLTGLLDFTSAAILPRLPLLFTAIVASLSVTGHPEVLRAQPLLIIGGTMCAGHAVAMLIGGLRIREHLGRPARRFFLPTGFWRFASFIHLNTICSFAYQRLDQVFVLAALGVGELGAYFVLWQCARLISFVPQRAGQVMLASFSHLATNGAEQDLRRAHRKLCRLVLLLSTALAIPMILFSRQVAWVFGPWYAERHLYLVLLAASTHIAALGTVNSMLIMSKRSTGLFLVNNLVQVALQLALTFLLIDSLGVYGVIAGKAAGLIWAQIGLFCIVRWKLDGIRSSPPAEYWLCLGPVLGATGLAILTDGRAPLAAGAALVLLAGLTVLLTGFRPSELKWLLAVKKERSTP